MAMSRPRFGQLALPPLAPPAGLVFRIRLPRDYYVRVHGNDYSVHPAAIGAMVDVAADLGLVRVRPEGRVIAEHPRSGGNAATIATSDGDSTWRFCGGKAQPARAALVVTAVLGLLLTLIGAVNGSSKPGPGQRLTAEPWS